MPLPYELDGHAHDDVERMKARPQARWMVDRSRYMDGFTCPWRRLLHYHANLEPLVTATPLVTGIAVHRSLELLCTTRGTATPAMAAESAAVAALSEQPPGIWESGSNAQLQKDLVVGLTHGYARTTLPWLLDNFTILATEEEQTLQVDHPSMPLTWMSRPDLICRHRATGNLSIHDFKTTSYWKDSNLSEWADNVQMMMNAHSASLTIGEPVSHYYVHFLVKGNEDYPSPTVSAWYREPMPPFQTEDWQVKRPSGRDMKYRKVRVADHTGIGEWVWRMPAEDLNKGFIVGGPFPVSPLKVRQFIAGLPANEWWWQQSLATFQLDLPRESAHLLWESRRSQLDSTFPRTYNCYTYGSRCPYYRVCFESPNEWQPHFKPRVPHHTTEEIE